MNFITWAKRKTEFKKRKKERKKETVFQMLFSKRWLFRDMVVS